jgi:broad specificity phosphatase PhoE
VTTIELVRHAKAHSRDQWWGRPDRERPLTEAGHAQARALARQLAVAEVTALYSSPYARCTQTLIPLAEALRLPLHEDDALAEAMTLPVLDGGDAWVASAWLGGRALSFINRIVREHPDGRIVACSHGDVIPALMAALAGRDDLDLREVRCRKGARFTLTFDGNRCRQAVAVPAPDR